MIICVPDLSSFLLAVIYVIPTMLAQSLRVNPEKQRIIAPGGKFHFDCPPVEQPGKVARYQVSWMHNNKIWLKIQDGHLAITEELSSFYPRQVGLHRNVVNVQLHDYRYKFDYSEMTGKFSMTIENVKEEDSGIWKCTVETSRDDTRHSYLMYSDVRQLRVGNSYTRSKPRGSNLYQHKANAGSHYNSVVSGRHHDNSQQVQTFKAGVHEPATFTQADSSRVGDVIVFQRTASAANSNSDELSRMRRLRSRYNNASSTGYNAIHVTWITTLFGGIVLMVRLA